MNTQVVMNETRTQIKPTAVIKSLFNFGVRGEWMLSKIINPKPPIEKRKLDAKPSIMYCPLTLYGMKTICKNQIYCSF